ncbi:hypothetical protein [Cyanobium gracile]|uniref:Uncharacterized protein n=1 Tax=Cyanobium gracile (strain ATCC 27147 / PCC 6307) TaxID=292564 RepID=K9P5D5_CYAGP|nr:hypothetical protein [Cyanobium gracile]AFY28208.1 hypothetical protein Cyagr_1027 [Cyanobium gracile PCC 6307]
MSTTTQAPPAAPLRSLSFLVAPRGQLSEDGQLRELVEERRQRKGADVELWYLGPELVEELRLAQAFRHPPAKDQKQTRPQEPIEAIVAGDAAVITWLQLRFGGCAGSLALPAGWLQERAAALPPRAPAADTATNTARAAWT